jgi:hypothetical protein
VVPGPLLCRIGRRKSKGSVPRIVAFWFIFVGLKFYGRRSVEAWLDLGFWKAAMPLWRVTGDGCLVGKSRVMAKD